MKINERSSRDSLAKQRINGRPFAMSGMLRGQLPPELLGHTVRFSALSQFQRCKDGHALCGLRSWWEEVAEPRDRQPYATAAPQLLASASATTCQRRAVISA
jgi:hypothetical protein